KAFGIYQAEDGNFVVYKNKANGQRAIRYNGPDEAYAVKELFLKLQDETELRKVKYGGRVGRSRNSKSGNKNNKLSKSNDGKSLIDLLLFGIVILILAALFGHIIRFVIHFLSWAVVGGISAFIFWMCSGEEAKKPKNKRSRTIGIIIATVGSIIALVMLLNTLGVIHVVTREGYYKYDDTYYYYDDGKWYSYDGYDWDRDFSGLPVDGSMYNDYYESYYFHDGYDGYSFRDTDYYNDNHSSSSSDSDYDSWDYDSWDSSDTDWDSDW
ncbi:MAG: APC family permease, partial [Lachnospiraceae bacterium]|nr:APC family permease [Lachnospiraceae bacterium]